MEAKYLIDSSILIDHLNGISQATKWLSRLEFGEAAISAITRAEVLVRAGEKETAISIWLEEYPCLAIDVEIASLAAKLRQQHKWKLPDAFQASLAEKHGLVLVTRDEKAFGKMSREQVKIPYKL